MKPQCTKLPTLYHPFLGYGVDVRNVTAIDAWERKGPEAISNVS